MLDLHNNEMKHLGEQASNWENQTVYERFGQSIKTANHSWIAYQIRIFNGLDKIENNEN